MQVKIEKQPKSTVKLIVKVPADKVKETYTHVLKEFAESTEIPGFRKGKAPLDLVEKSGKQADINGETVNHLLQHYYVAAVKEHQLNPIGNPKVNIQKFDKDADFEFEAEMATRPEIKLKDYRKELKRVREEKSKADGEDKHVSVDDVIKAISKDAEADFSDLLVEDEVTRMLTRLLQQAETLGLSIDQYLSAQNKTAESLRVEYEEAARKSILAEFALSKAIEQEEIKVEDKEIEEAINAVPDEKIRTELQNGKDRWYIVSVLAKNKLIQKLLSEIDGEKDKKEDK